MASRPIAIIGGAGAEGFGLALRWAQAGETVIIGSRDAARAQQAADKIKQRVANANISGMENAGAAGASDLIVLTIPFEVHAATLKQLKPAIRTGSIVVDTTVPLAAALADAPPALSASGKAPPRSRPLKFWAKKFMSSQPFITLVRSCSRSRARSIATSSFAVTILPRPKPSVSSRPKFPASRALDGGKLENARILEQITALLIGFSIRDKGHAGIRITGLPDLAYKS